MNNRFTFKDFVYLVLILVVIASVLLEMAQFSYQEQRLNLVKDQLSQLNETQKHQTEVLTQLSEVLRSGVKVNAPSTTPSSTTGPDAAADASGIIRRHNPDGSYYVYFPHLPTSAKDPHTLPGYSPGDWIVDNLGDEPAVITPYLEGTASEASVQGPVLESLISRDRVTFEWQPYLAESYTIMPDQLTFRFVLRQGICFSDGAPLTADDVIFSFNTAGDPRIDADRYRATLDRIKSVTKVDDRTIDFTFKETYFKALETAGGLSIIPKHIYQWTKPEEFNNNKNTLIGSGPYMLEPGNWIRGQKFVLTRNPRYWGPKPTFDRQVYLFITNPQAAFQSFQSGDIDSFTPDPVQYEKFTKDQDFVKRIKFYTYQLPNGGYRYIGWNMARPMFRDKLTRQALTELIDRDAIIKTIQRGFGIKITGPFSSLTTQSDKTIAPWPYDPEDARKKLAAAGWVTNADGLLERDGKPFKFEFSIPAKSPVYEKSAVYIKEQFRKVGIDMTITPYEFSVLGENLDKRKVDAAMLGWTADVEEDPTQIWHSKSISGKGSNWVAFNNPEADKLIEEGVRELDDNKRMEIWHKLHHIFHEEQPYTFLLGAVARVFIDKRFENTDPDKSGLDSSVWYVPAANQKYH